MSDDGLVIPKLPVRTMATLSTAHIEPATAECLERMDSLVVYQYAEGFFVVVPDEPLEEDDQIPAELRLLLAICKDQRIGMLRLDGDGEVVSGLPEFSLG